MAQQKVSTDWTDDDSVASEWVDEQRRMDRMLAPFGDLVLEAAGLRQGERVLDVGCGTGSVTAAAWEAVTPSGVVTGIDVSPAMLAAACDRLSHCGDGVRLICADAGTYSFPRASVD